MKALILAMIYVITNFFTFLAVDVERVEDVLYNQQVNFERISAEEMNVTDEEKKNCREWFDDNLLLRNGIKELPYNFKYGTKTLNKTIDDWTFDVSAESEVGEAYRGGKTSYITLKHKTNGIVATVEATIYEEKATCDWTVFIKNEGNENSETISNFYALDKAFETGASEVYFSKGSRDEAYDFVMLNKNLTAFDCVFNSIDGRSTDKYLPYFNIAGESEGIVLAVGWSGFWETKLKELSGVTTAKVGQENLKAYLLPDEEVRSPLVSLTFYENENPLKGFNMFRSWITDCVYPENIPDTMTMMEVAGPLSTSTAQQIMDTMNTFKPFVFENVDYFWMDAGWYKYNEGWHDTVGTWVPDENRYPNGIKELSDYGKEKGCKLVLWYEPERVVKGTPLYDAGINKDGWIISFEDDDNTMYNLGNEEALQYLSELIAASLKENGVSLYRQDFNFSPEKYWKQADEALYDGRAGICENHYISGEYAFLDYLTDNIDGLIIDNCASGGRRLDLEMARRSIPVWRSDYNCAPHYDIMEATQSMTYGLSFWLPLSGTLQYNDNEYNARSSIMPFTLETFGTIHSPYFSVYKPQREMMSEKYYPLESGTYLKNKILAMQYSDNNAEEGYALVYKRINVKETEYTLKLNGLKADTQYEVYDIDSPETVYTLTGEELMYDGIKLQLPDGEKAFIIMFSAK